MSEHLRSEMIQTWEIDHVKIDDGYICNIKVTLKVMSFAKVITGASRTFGGTILLVSKTFDREWSFLGPTSMW